MTEGFIGDLGAGKTLNMVKALMEQMKHGRKVISNTPIKFSHKGQIYQSVTIYDSKQFEKAVVNAWNATIAIDEASVFFPASYWNKVKPEMIYKFAQSRKMRCDLMYTSQGWGHTIKRLRDLTNWVVFCYRRRFLRTFKPYIYHATLYRPDFFMHRILDPKKRKMYILREWDIYPSEAKRIFKAYNTFFRIKGSALVNMKDIDDKFEIVQTIDNDTLLKEDVDISVKSPVDLFTTPEIEIPSNTSSEEEYGKN